MATKHKFSESILIAAPREEVFDFTQDYSKRLQWDTFLIRARLLNATHAEVGVRAYCVARNRLGMETEYVSFHRPRVAAVKMTKGPFFFEQFSASWKFVETTPESSTVTFLYSFSLRFPFSIFARMIKRNLRNNVRQRLRDLQRCFDLKDKS